MILLPLAFCLHAFFMHAAPSTVHTLTIGIGVVAAIVNPAEGADAVVLDAGAVVDVFEVIVRHAGAPAHKHWRWQTAKSECIHVCNLN
jgi:hypothetical protein